MPAVLRQRLAADLVFRLPARSRRRLRRRGRDRGTRQIKQDVGTAEVKVLILNTFDRDEYVYSTLRAGASGFLLEVTTPEKLLDAIRVVASGEGLLAPTVTQHLIEVFTARVSAARHRRARRPGHGHRP